MYPHGFAEARPPPPLPPRRPRSPSGSDPPPPPKAYFTEATGMTVRSPEVTGSPYTFFTVAPPPTDSPMDRIISATFIQPLWKVRQRSEPAHNRGQSRSFSSAPVRLA